MIETASSEWAKEEVINRLRQQAQAGELPAAQIFLSSPVTVERARDLISQAARHLGVTGDDTIVGKVFKLAQSFTVRGDADVIAELSRLKDVVAILPSQVSDILPKPRL